MVQGNNLIFRFKLMRSSDAMSNLSYKALSNDEGKAGSFNATVQQHLMKIPWEQLQTRL